MLVVVTYDIAASDASGHRRLHRVAGICGRWGIAVQHSVYECEVDAGECQQLETELSGAICWEKDSVRIDCLGNRFQKRVRTLGCAGKAWEQERYVL